MRFIAATNGQFNRKKNQKELNRNHKKYISLQEAIKTVNYNVNINRRNPFRQTKLSL